jgi:hypothetical protein
MHGAMDTLIKGDQDQDHLFSYNDSMHLARLVKPIPKLNDISFYFLKILFRIP